MRKKRAVLVWRGCGTCSTMKKNGLCKKEVCIPVSSKLGKEISKKIGLKYVPQAVEINGNKVKKISNTPILKKYLK